MYIPSSTGFNGLVLGRSFGLAAHHVAGLVGGEDALPQGSLGETMGKPWENRLISHDLTTNIMQNLDLLGFIAEYSVQWENGD